MLLYTLIYNWKEWHMLILLTLLMLLQVFYEDNLKKIQEFLGLSVYSASMPVGRDLSDPAGDWTWQLAAPRGAGRTTDSCRGGTCVALKSLLTHFYSPNVKESVQMPLVTFPYPSWERRTQQGLLPAAAAAATERCAGEGDFVLALGTMAISLPLSVLWCEGRVVMCEPRVPGGRGVQALLATPISTHVGGKHSSYYLYQEGNSN